MALVTVDYMSYGAVCSSLRQLDGTPQTTTSEMRFTAENHLPVTNKYNRTHSFEIPTTFLAVRICVKCFSTRLAD
jgi:hypothetical protein